MKGEKMRKICFKRISGVVLILMLVFGVLGYGIGNQGLKTILPVRTTVAMEMSLEENQIPLSNAPVSPVLMPVASNIKVLQNNSVTIDASNVSHGYIMINCKDKTEKRKKVVIKGPSGVQYTYNVTKIDQYEVFPLSDGNGTYTVGVYRNTSGTKYAALYTGTLSVTLINEFAPFLLPNQYVNYTPEMELVKVAAQLTGGVATDLEKIEKIYNYVVNNVSYDKELAQSVQTGYLPVLDVVLKSKKGICFDYAALMTGMLRSQNIPTKLVVGNSGTVYHAWINTYTKEEGWIDNIIYFNGTQWTLMDPTFASSGKGDQKILEYIGNVNNYSARYLY